jgi:hypothetical protein
MARAPIVMTEIAADQFRGIVSCCNCKGFARGLVIEPAWDD